MPANPEDWLAWSGQAGLRVPGTDLERCDRHESAHQSWRHHVDMGIGAALPRLHGASLVAVGWCWETQSPPDTGMGQSMRSVSAGSCGVDKHTDLKWTPLVVLEATGADPWNNWYVNRRGP